MEITYLWVDEILHTGLGETNDLEKIYYNLEQMGDLGKELDQHINIELLLVQQNAMAVSGAGEYICIIKFEKDINKGNMLLCHYRLRTENMWRSIANEYSPKIVDEFMRIYREIVSLSPSESGLFELSISRPL
jgi:hypothetical protein